MNKISIIVPAYNVALYIERCLDSILSQTYKNLEIIVVNDGSTDNTKDILDDYSQKNERIKVIHKDNGGVTSARLKGLELSTGDYIGFVDGDDTIDEDMYELLISNALKYDADISHCGYKMIFDDGRIHYFHNTKSVISQDKRKGIKDLLDGIVVEPGLWNKLYKKELFNDLEIDTSIKINEDLLMNYYLFKNSNISVFDDQCKYNYLVRYASVSRQKLNLNKIYDPIKVKEIILNDCDEDILNDAKRAYISTCIYCYSGLTIEGNNYKREKKYIRKIICNNKEYIRLLSRKTSILGKLIVYIPMFFDIIYPIYSSKFQKKKYE